ncbi:MAG: protein kinase [Anaerolineae bacterium]
MDPLIGQRLGQYEIVELLGTGGMAKVYRSRQVSMDRGVAIKVIKQDLMETEGFAERFRREAKIIASLSHPHILKVFDFGTEGNLAYIVMELLNGGSLNKLVAVRGPLHSDVVGRVLSQICQALDYAHAQGIVHRDLKPENVLLDSTENAFLTDFGIAKLLEDSAQGLTATGIAMGTPSYMSPEQWQGAVLDARSDLYSLGIMLFEMLTGQVPFNKPTPAAVMYQHLTETPPSLALLRPDLPTGAEFVLLKAIAKLPDDRYQSASQMARAFRKAMSGGSRRSTSLNAAAPLPDEDTIREGLAPVPAPPVQPSARSVTPTALNDERTSAGIEPGWQTAPAPIKPTGAGRSPIPLIAVVVVLLAVVIGGLALLANRPNAAEPTVASTGNTSIAILPSETPLIASPTIADTATPAESATATDTGTPTLTAREAALATIGVEQTQTAESFTDTPTPDFLQTVIAEQTLIAIEFAEFGQTETANAIASFTATATNTFTPSATWTLTPTATDTLTFTPTNTPAPTDTPIPTATFTPTPVPPTAVPTTRVPPTPDSATGALATLAAMQTAIVIAPTATPTPIGKVDMTATARMDKAWTSDRNKSAYQQLLDAENDAVRTYGPYADDLVDNEAGYLATYARQISVRNCIIRVRFYNIPSLKGTYGIIFRDQSNGSDQYRVFIDYTRRWAWAYGSKSLNFFASNAIDNSVGGFNDLEVLVNGGIALFFINGTLTNRLDVSELTTAGGVSVFSGTYAGQPPSGETTRFENFTITELP